MLAAGQWIKRNVLEIRSIGRRKELPEEGDAAPGGVFRSQQNCLAFAPGGFPVNLPSLAKDTRESEAPEGVPAAVIPGDERSVKSMHQNVIPERRCIVQFGRGGRECGGGPCQGKCMRTAYIIRLDHVASLIHIQAVGWIRGNAWRIEDANGGKGVSRAPANDTAAEREVEVPRGQACVSFPNP